MYVVFTDNSYVDSSESRSNSGPRPIVVCTSAPYIGFNVTYISGNYFERQNVIIPHQ